MYLPMPEDSDLLPFTCASAAVARPMCPTLIIKRGTCRQMGNRVCHSPAGSPEEPCMDVFKTPGELKYSVPDGHVCLFSGAHLIQSSKGTFAGQGRLDRGRMRPSPLGQTCACGVRGSGLGMQSGSLMKHIG